MCGKIINGADILSLRETETTINQIANNHILILLPFRLEVELRKFACLTKGDLIAVLYNDQVLEFLVQEVKPGNAVSIIECDMNVEFDAPEGYVEPTAHRPSEPSFAKVGIRPFFFSYTL